MLEGDNLINEDEYVMFLKQARDSIIREELDEFEEVKGEGIHENELEEFKSSTIDE